MAFIGAGAPVMGPYNPAPASLYLGDVGAGWPAGVSPGDRLIMVVAWSLAPDVNVTFDVPGWELLNADSIFHPYTGLLCIPNRYSGYLTYTRTYNPADYPSTVTMTATNAAAFAPNSYFAWCYQLFAYESTDIEFGDATNDYTVPVLASGVDVGEINAAIGLIPFALNAQTNNPSTFTGNNIYTTSTGWVNRHSSNIEIVKAIGRPVVGGNVIYDPANRWPTSLTITSADLPPGMTEGDTLWAWLTLSSTTGVTCSNPAWTYQGGATGSGAQMEGWAATYHPQISALPVTFSVNSSSLGSWRINLVAWSGRTVANSTSARVSPALDATFPLSAFSYTRAPVFHATYPMYVQVDWTTTSNGYGSDIGAFANSQGFAEAYRAPYIPGYGGGFVVSKKGEIVPPGNTTSAVQGPTHVKSTSDFGFSIRQRLRWHEVRHGFALYDLTDPEDSANPTYGPYFTLNHLPQPQCSIDPMVALYAIGEGADQNNGVFGYLTA